MTKIQIVASAFTLLLAANSDAQSLDGKFRGMYVCAKLPTTRDILHVPIDLVVRGNTVQFARPLFNLDGTRVHGSELAAGTIDSNGAVHLTSTWSFLGNTAEANYSGSLTPSGGTLTGTQSWRGPDGGPALNRPCTAALVPAPEVTGAQTHDDTSRAPN